MAWLTLRELSRLGVQIETFLVVEESASAADLDDLSALDGVTVRPASTKWEWRKWYSRNRLSQVITGQMATAAARRRLGREVRRCHRQMPFDLLYHYSSIETFGMGRHLAELPPLVLHPSTSAVGELRWLRNERDLAERCDGRMRSAVVRAWLRLRVVKQKRDVKGAAAVLGKSRVYSQQFVVDYKVPTAKVRVVPNPVDLELFRPRDGVVADDPRRIAFVGRIAVRKGVEDVVELSHRLSDLAGKVVIEIVGGTSLWSNYLPLLDDLDPSMAHYRGALSRQELADWLPTCTCLIQPAKYEPFGSTVAEALASGVPVIATTEVGAAEDVSPGCVTLIDPASPEQLESSVRELLVRMASPDATKISALARSESVRLWSPDRVAGDLIEHFGEILSRKAVPT